MCYVEVNFATHNLWFFIRVSGLTFSIYASQWLKFLMQKKTASYKGIIVIPFLE